MLKLTRHDGGHIYIRPDQIAAINDMVNGSEIVLIGWGSSVIQVKEQFEDILNGTVVGNNAPTVVEDVEEVAS